MKKPLVFLILVFLVLQDPLHAQTTGTLQIVAGYGYYQGFHIGANYFYHEYLSFGAAAGSHFGFSPLDEEKHFNISAEHNLLFGKPNRQDVKPFVFSQQLMYWEQGPETDRWKILSLGLNIGLALPLGNRLGINIEAGPAFNLVLDVDHDPNFESTGWMFPVLYNGRLRLIYFF